MSIPDLSSIKKNNGQPTNQIQPVQSQEVIEDEPLDMSFLNDEMGSSMGDLMPEPEPPKDPEILAKEDEQRIVMLLYFNKFPSDLAIIAQELTNEKIFKD